MTNMGSVLLIISGSIAAYKSLELIRRLRDYGITVNTILTPSGSQFVTPLSVASLSGNPVYSDLFSLKDEVEMGHIRLSRESDVVLVAPASANLIAKLAAGQADDLATTALLATDKPVLLAPAMNVKMWEHPATQRNLKQIKQDGVEVIEPESGALACGEEGAGRLASLEQILEQVLRKLQRRQPLSGMKAIVTSGPTYEMIDPVRFIGNRSSGKQGYAIAESLSCAGAEVTLISGPSALPPPPLVTRIAVESADEMLRACQASLPVDIAVFAAAVSDWKLKKPFRSKLKKRGNEEPPALELTQTADVLASIALESRNRPKLVVGFAAETEKLVLNAKDKRRRKGCDWIVANEVSEGAVFGKEHNQVTLIRNDATELWPLMAKSEVADRLTQEIIQFFSEPETNPKVKRYA